MNIKPAHQISFSEMEYAHKRKQTRKDKFLTELELLVPWGELLEALQPLIITTTLVVALRLV